MKTLIKGGKKYFLNALLGTMFLSAFLAVFADGEPITEDRLLASIYGGILAGVGVALILRVGGSTRWHGFAVNHYSKV